MILYLMSEVNFMSWFSNLNTDCVQYIYSHSKRHRKGHRTSYYSCNRSGVYKPLVLPQNRKRKLKSQGSCKLNVLYIGIENLQTNRFFVTYYKTHTHEKEIQHIHISKDDEANIASNLMTGVTVKSWHIDRAWQSNLNEIANLEKRKNVYKTLKYLQYTLEENKFIEELNSTMLMLWDDIETQYGIYHERINLAIGFEFYRKNIIESFFETFKTITDYQDKGGVNFR
ncbi:hypothetical protein NQ315_011280 [Exocentrus adspersus]|uniref:Transposase n=1 Tax=Exocentrus adspersus TaxID=1586481 RepID=A0AAV8VJG5_9CUCU|nr:hypothetical protein NQ315_011280 [Exocentrus adspersus]